MKRIITLMLLCAAVIFAGCSKDDEPAPNPNPAPVSGVTLDKPALSLEIGKTATLVATIAPKDAAVTIVAWSSDKPAVATVDDKGLVTAVAEGTAVITVKTEDGGKTATCTVTVTKAGIAVTEVKLNVSGISIAEGMTTDTLTVTVLPANATDQTVTWASSDETIATVSDKGLVTAVKAGTATITVTSVADNTKKATCEVTVEEKKSITWATGNLVADGANGAKIGLPTDNGLYFQFGSLVGWSVEDPLAIVVRPVGCTVAETWDKYWTGADPTQDSDDAVTGKGDPCRYYLGTTWRLPTEDEYVALFKDNGYPTTGPWKWDTSSTSATNDELNLTFPASGYRDNRSSSLDNIGTSGSYWSASPERDRGYNLYFSSSDVRPSNTGYRSYGLPVRCVQEK